MLHRLRSGAALAALLSLIAPAAFAQTPTRNLQLLAHWNEYPPQAGSPFGAGYSACWSYIHGDGREYAVIGVTDGVVIYNVTNPSATYKVAFIPGPHSAWHEMKSYRNWIYVVNENGVTGNVPAPGIQIIRMTDPEHPVLAATYAVNFHSSHTVSIDTTRALLVCNGTRAWSGIYGTQTGMRILSIANPESPIEIGAWPGGAGVADSQYVHDSVVIGTRLYASSIYAGTQRIFDFTNPALPIQLTAWTYPQAFYSHNSWPDKTGSFLYVTDEQNGQTLRVFDISNLSAPKLVYEYTDNPQAIVHNAFVLGDTLYLANYTEGIKLLDITDPAHPAEFASADTYAGPSGGFAGVWAVCPYFPSGTVIASDMQTGLYVFRPVRDYGLLRVKVVDASTSQPMAGVTVRLTTQGDSTRTAADGIAQFAPSPGVQTVQAGPYGYNGASATRGVTRGSRDTVTLALSPKPVANLNGIVKDAQSLSPLTDGEVDLAYTGVSAHTDASGHFALNNVPENDYRVEIRRPGYIPQAFVRHIGPSIEGTEEFRLTPAKSWDSIGNSSGWTVGAAGDQAVSNDAGQWIRVHPLGTRVAPASASNVAAALYARAADAIGCAVSKTSGHLASSGPAHTMSCDSSDPTSCALSGCMCGCIVRPISGATPGAVQPNDDRSPSPDSLCFVTGQGVDSTSIDEADVDGGRTTLTSPPLDLTAMNQPTIGLWKWFYSEFGSADDWLAILISGDNGATWVPVDTTRGEHNAWEEENIPVSMYVTPSPQVRLRFIAADLGAPSVVEAAIDDITTYDAASPTIGVGRSLTPGRLALRAPYPNPSSGSARLVVDLPRSASVTVEVLDLAGRRVTTLHRGPASAGALNLSWDGTDAAGRVCPAGLYCARATTGKDWAEARVVRVR